MRETERGHYNVDPSYSDKQNRSNTETDLDDRNMKHVTMPIYFAQELFSVSLTCSPNDNLIQTKLFRSEGRPIVMGHFRLCKHDYVLSGRSTHQTPRNTNKRWPNIIIFTLLTLYNIFRVIRNVFRENISCNLILSTSCSIYIKLRKFEL